MNVWFVSFLLKAVVSKHRVSRAMNAMNATFLLNYEQLLTYLKSIRPCVMLVAGDFNVRSSSWRSNEIDATKRARLESITSYYGLYHDK